ncbi:MAG: hypothetical protein LBO63_03110 [Oscillospiraceae bacterium]|jgi:hypothetical protein|nr:hypothetical protein [Oscillospiraceae bacterium]
MNGNPILITALLILGATAAIWLPALLERRLKITIHTAAKVIFVAFLFCSIFLGEVFDFFYRIPRWDDILHCTSGALTAYLAFIVLQALSARSSGSFRLPAAACAVFAFCFALSVGAVWELYEFSMDGLFGMNMQKAVLQSGEILAGHTAIADTMADIAVDCAGAVLASLLCCLSAKRRKATAAAPARGTASYRKADKSQAA